MITFYQINIKGSINEKIKTLLCSGQRYTKDEALTQFDIFYNERLEYLKKTITDNTIKEHKVFDLIFGIYVAFAKQNLPHKALMMDFMRKETIGAWQSCGFYKFTVSINEKYNLENVWQKFTTIDKAQFTSFFGQSCINLIAAIEHILKSKEQNGKQFNEELADIFKIGPKIGDCFLNADAKLADLVMIDYPPTTTQGRPEQDKPNYLELVLNDLRNFFEKNENLGCTVLKKISTP